ncbi:hypothetical protein PGT21_003851 [Puccinia graminis f. sp. tritici]|uniref:Uncharacterized protein n=1 Tax=Puccinia graminis f. sp. tritici TaxID=56615 RepID=A0A5B0NIC5_PUCGR|nr:hypothetical protein PGTUg99_019455 [Puccinia graminis f. sp. tritici]KAA1105353.1 hypothetical protein PGT21_003851 [Puccinia graminis f. sp. tritici]
MWEHSRDEVLRIGYQSTGTMVCYHCPRLLGSDALEESHPGTPWQCDGHVYLENLTLSHSMERVATRKVVAGNDLERRFAQPRCSAQRIEVWDTCATFFALELHISHIDWHARTNSLSERVIRIWMRLS